MIDLWQRANEIIPGGNMLFSKTPDRYCPGRWPAYYTKAQGITIQATDGKQYQDFSVMGAGNSVLGYGDPDVTGAVIQAIDEGNVSTLNCPEEVELAEVMLALNPGMDMVRFGRSGNDACQIALRIAQEYTGNQEFAICGYHGWQIGHPPQLDPLCEPFEYGDADRLMDILDMNEPCAVIMECVRTKPLDIPFLQEVRKLTDAFGVPLIFDEIASGFRCNLGGYHQLIGVQPDIALYGKAMGNGHAISAVVGKREIMEAAKNTFISSMFWSERTGYAAALATIDKMREIKAQDTICKIGRKVKTMWGIASQEAGLDLEISGLDPLATFNIIGDADRRMLTTFTQEMLKRGYLAGNQFYASVKHDNKSCDEYFRNIREVFAGIADGSLRLEGEPARAGFTRLA